MPKAKKKPENDLEALQSEKVPKVDYDLLNDSYEELKKDFEHLKEKLEGLEANEESNPPGGISVLAKALGDGDKVTREAWGNPDIYLDGLMLHMPDGSQRPLALSIEDVTATDWLVVD